MNKIPLECVVANYFGECENETEVSLAVLAKIKYHIEGEFRKLNKWVFIDNCRDSITDVYNSRYFSPNYNNNSISFNRSRIEDFYMDLYAIYNSKIDKEIKFEFLIMFEKYMEKMKKENIRQERKLKLKEIKNVRNKTI